MVGFCYFSETTFILSPSFSQGEREKRSISFSPYASGHRVLDLGAWWAGRGGCRGELAVNHGFPTSALPDILDQVILSCGVAWAL